MDKSIPVDRKKRGRPPGRDFPVQVQLRLNEEQVAALDAWRAEKTLPSRSEAIRVILGEYLKRRGHLR